MAVTLLHVLLLGAIATFAYGQAVDTDFEFEDIDHSDEGADWVWRSNAHGQKSLRLNNRDRKAVILTLCVRPKRFLGNVTAQIKNIRYSNDGPSDRVVLSVQGRPVGAFSTHSIWNNGYHWNQFFDTGYVGRQFVLRGGFHRFRIAADTDMYGVEIDSIKFETTGQADGAEFVCDPFFESDTIKNV